MAILTHDELINSITEEAVQPQEIVGIPSDEAPYQPTEGEKVSAAFKSWNTIGSAISNGFNDAKIDDPNFDRVRAIKGTEWEPYGEYFMYADNEDEVDQVKQRITKEMETAQIAQNGGWTGLIYNFAAGVLDPTLAIPIIGTASKIRTLSGVAKIGAQSAAGTAGAVGVQESLLHTSQLMRTKEESAYNMATGAILGGVLGSAIGAVSAGRYAIADKVVNHILKTGEPPPIHSGSVGAAEAGITDASIANMPAWMAKAVTMPGFRAPIVEGLTSKSPFLRDVSSRLFENNLIKERNRVGIKTNPEILKELEAQGYKVERIEGDTAILKGDKGNVPFSRNRPAMEEPVNMETKLKEDMSQSLQYTKEIQKEYLNYLGVKPGAVQGERAFLASRKQGKMSAKEFYEQAGKGTRRTEKTGNEYIDRSVEILRKQIAIQNQKMKELAEQGNIFEQFLNDLQLKGRESYFTIIGDKNKILGNRTQIEDAIVDHYVTKAGLDPAEARSIGSTYLDHLVGLDNSSTLNDMAKSAIDKGVKFTKERTVDIPDTVIEAGLVNDILQVGKQYIENSNKMIRFQEFLNSVGEKNIAGLRRRLDEEYRDTLAKVPKEHGDANKIMAAHTANYERNKVLLDDFVAMSLGQFNRRTVADRSLRFLRTYNYVRLMGNIVLSSVTDLAMPIFKHGLGRTIMDGYVQGAKNWYKGASKLVNKDLSDIYVALDLEMNNTLRTIVDPDFVGQYSSRAPEVGAGRGAQVLKTAKDIGYGINAGMDYAAEKFGRLSGIDYWNTMNKRLGARVVESRIIRDVKNYDSLPNAEKEYLNSIGIGSNQVKPLLSQLDKYAGEHNGGFLTNVNEWTDRKIAEIFKGAIIKEVDSTVVTPGKGDIPRVSQRYELARTLLQFKGFFSAMTTKVLISGMQRRDTSVMQGVLGLLTLGAAQYNIRMTMEGKTPDNSPDNLLKESINRSGILGLLGDPLFGMVLRPWTSGSRYMNQSVVEYPLGPSASIIKDMYKVYSDSMNLDWDDKTAKSAGHLVPYQNLIILRQSLNLLDGKEEND